jgi:hypothetical protein
MPCELRSIINTGRFTYAHVTMPQAVMIDGIQT